MNINTIYNCDCMKLLPKMLENSVNLTLTDIPYDVVNRNDNGLRTLSKDNADKLTFEIKLFLEELYRITKGTIIIFCAKEQLSYIYKFFQEKQSQNEGTVRQLIWEKVNPSPMNGESIYLSGIENAVWFKKRGSVFNAHCKNTVFRYPCGKSVLHPTEKNHDLLKELILDNSNENDIVFDPCCGSGAHCLVANCLNRNFIGIEIDNEYFKLAQHRIELLDNFNCLSDTSKESNLPMGRKKLF